MSLKINCPKCKKPFLIPDGSGGSVVHCPSCLAPARLRATAPPAAVAVPPPPASDLAEAALPVARVAEDPAEVSAAFEKPVKGVIFRTPEQHKARGVFLGLIDFFFGTANPTDVSIWTSGMVAGLLTAGLYYGLVFSVLQGTYVGNLLGKRGWVPPVTVLLTFWAAVILFFKWVAVQTQKRSLRLPLLPDGSQTSIQIGIIDLLQSNLHRLPRVLRRSFLVNRIDMALEHFKVRRNVQEVGTVLSAQADIDAARVESSYMMLKVFIWAIPILGFIGTVVGISEAVSGFTGAVDSAGKLEEVKKALGNVTQGLAVAFDTTLIALVLSIFIMFPANSLQKSEENLLSSIDEYCHENLLRHLEAEGPVLAGPVAGPAPPSKVDVALVNVLAQLRESVEQLRRELQARADPVDQVAAARQKEQLLIQAMKDHLALLTGMGSQLLSTMANQSNTAPVDGQTNSH